MRPTSGDSNMREGYRPYIEDYLLHLPDAFDDFRPQDGARACRAWNFTAPRPPICAAHVVETREPISAEGANPVQMR